MDPIIVRGAGKGLGRSIASKLIDDGYPIVAIDLNENLLADFQDQFPSMVEPHVLTYPISRSLKVSSIQKRATPSAAWSTTQESTREKHPRLFDRRDRSSR